MTFHFDRCFGKRFPQALRTADPPFTVEFHHDPGNKFEFTQTTPDDEWLAKVGAEGWIVFSHDRKFHKRLPERTAIKQHKVGCFYLWGANEGIWLKTHCFMRGYDNIARCVATTPKAIYLQRGTRRTDQTSKDSMNTRTSVLGKWYYSVSPDSQEKLSGGVPARIAP